MMTQTIESLPLWWETRTELVVAGSDLAQSWLLGSFGEELADGTLSFSLSDSSPFK